MIKAIIFDFDGVLAESVEVKGTAFEALFGKESPRVKKEIVAYHLKNGGVSRYEKIKHIYKHILHKQLSAVKYKGLLKEFSSIVVGLVCNSQEVRGANDFLKKNYARIPLYVVSATPSAELRHIIRKRHMYKYFKGIYGIPPEKAETVIKILKKEKLAPLEALYVGDSVSDLNAAKITGVNFLLRKTNNNTAIQNEFKHTIDDLGGLEKIIAKKYK